jgi:hypothetical protein
MNFERDNDNPLKTMRIGRTVFDELKDHPVCRSLNDPLEDINGKVVNPRDPNIRVWINPCNQTCFSFGWCTEKNLRDWMNGTGIIVKGKTPEEKKKVWDYAVFESSDENHIYWSILHHWKWFKELKSDFNPHKFRRYIADSLENPIKITKNNHKQVILDMYVPFIKEISEDIEYREWSNIRTEFNKNFYGVKRTLISLGVGTIGACNTPEEIENLSWIDDLIFAKAYYLYLVKTGVKLPDFEWLSNNGF